MVDIHNLNEILMETILKMRDLEQKIGIEIDKLNSDEVESLLQEYKQTRIWESYLHQTIHNHPITRQRQKLWDKYKEIKLE